MNDRYLYRAKRKNWRELPKEVWLVEGYYAFVDNHHYIYTGNPYYGGLYVAAERYEIDRDNLCACTGLKDKNGKLIWENDVVEMYDRNTDYRWRAVVTFGNPNGEYTWGWQLKPIVECEANTDILCWIDMEESGATCEVIGSAIDNPELLEVGE